MSKHRSDLLAKERELYKKVECLGRTFETDKERRDYYSQRLREYFRDPIFRSQISFPIGDEDDIIALSDPPFYTACPNPFIGEFLEYFGRRYESSEVYSREPFAADVSEGKNDPVYNAHSYHTKVPYKAILHYILHYTNPGDVVFDGFCGTGMTGIAASACSDKNSVESLGYRVDSNSNVYNHEGIHISKMGNRSSVLCDLSPIATFIAANLNRPADRGTFQHYAEKIMGEVWKECGWMYETTDPKSHQKGMMNYVVWSDVLLCPECGTEFVYWDVAVEHKKNLIKDRYDCPSCSIELSRKELTRKFETIYDFEIGQTIRRPQQIPVLINYSIEKKRFEKRPDNSDFDLLDRLYQNAIPYPVPVDLMMFKGTNWGDQFRGCHVGTTHVHHFYTKRNLWILASIFSKILSMPNSVRNMLIAWFTGSQSRLTRLNRYMPNHGRHVGPLSGTYYMSSLPTEISPFYFLNSKISDFSKINMLLESNSIVSTTSVSQSSLPDNSIDYIFTDPPFGDNLPYSELNFLWESWLKVYTNNHEEAIVSKSQRKDIQEYTSLMKKCFHEYYRVLKPGRWLTVEFHNSRNAVWNAIQEAVGAVGFVISDVRTLDKKKGTTKQLSYTSGAVKQDLVISAYKPTMDLEESFRLGAGTENAMWNFVREHLEKLPVFVTKDRMTEVISERQSYLLFDRMVAFHVQRGIRVPFSAAEFYTGLEERFVFRDSMCFLPTQIAEYDKKRLTVRNILQLQLSVSDEASAIQWLKQQLTRKPQTFQDLQPQFLKETGGWQKHEQRLELSELLEQNFLRYDGKGDIPNQIHSHLSTNYKGLRNLPKNHTRLRLKGRHRWYVPDPSKSGDLEKLRERALLREFKIYQETKQRHLKLFRLESLRAGFKKAWQERDYATILSVSQKIPENVLQEDSKLLMWYDQALNRTGKKR